MKKDSRINDCPNTKGSFYIQETMQLYHKNKKWPPIKVAVLYIIFLIYNLMVIFINLAHK
jgi:hypothetical protein